MRLKALRIAEQQKGGKQDTDECIKEFSVYTRPSYVSFHRIPV